MQPNDMTIVYKVISFLCLHNDVSKNLVLSNVGTFSVFREQFENAMNLGETSYVVSTTHGHGRHAQELS